MIPNDESTIAQFVQKHGAIFTPGNQFFHRAIADFLSGLGFVVLSVEKLDTHPVWQFRLRMTPNAQLHVLVELPHKGSPARQSEDPLAEQLRQLMSRAGFVYRAERERRSRCSFQNHFPHWVYRIIQIG
jgi:hypothetical protein